MLKWILLSSLVVFVQRISPAQTLNTGNQPASPAKTTGQWDTHLVSQGETLYALSKKYHTTVEELLVLNPSIVDNNLQAGSTLKIPVVNFQETLQKGASKKENALFYTVAKKETLYSISKRYGTDVETLMLWNDLQTPDIQEGQKLIVGYESKDLKVVGPLSTTRENSSAGEKKPDAKITSTNDGNAASEHQPVSSSTEKDSEATASPADGLEQIDEKGIATWVKSGADDGSFYALHPTATAGTEVMITNPMNKKFVTVKVVGKLPDTSENENVMIKISASAAKKLGVLDSRFLAEISYRGSKPDEKVSDAR